MNFFEAIVLGLVQALTEYLPVSSSAHIRILGDLMLGSDPGAAFTAIIQLGTELAVLLYFRRDIINILSAWFRCLFGREGSDWRSRMGAGNKLDGSAFRVADLEKTRECPLAKIVRRELKKRGIEHLPVVWSDELPKTGDPDAVGSVSFVPPVMGLLMAGFIVGELVNDLS